MFIISVDLDISNVFLAFMTYPENYKLLWNFFKVVKVPTNEASTYLNDRFERLKS